LESSRGAFCTAINCMDGRVQLPVIEYMKARLGVVYVDNITEPGPVRALGDAGQEEVAESIVRRVGASVEGHGSEVVAVVAHHDCTGNPLDKGAQLAQLVRSADLISGRFPAVRVLGVWVDEHGAVHEELEREPKRV
jgi:heterodisulfide reductase subunit A-like polyferredoxin